MVRHGTPRRLPTSLLDFPGGGRREELPLSPGSRSPVAGPGARRDHVGRPVRPIRGIAQGPPHHGADTRSDPPAPTPLWRRRLLAGRRVSRLVDRFAGGEVTGDSRFTVRLTPRGGSDRVEGVVEGDLKARVSAPSVGGAANQALVRLIAEELEISRSAVRLVAGAAGRRKLIVVEGIEPDRLMLRWPGLRV